MEKKLNNNSLKILEKKLDYKFRDISLIREALTHSSKNLKTINQKKFNYERFEFLGDRILGFIVAEFFLKKKPNLEVDKLHSICHKFINENHLYNVALMLKVNDFVITQNGDDLHLNKSILADVIESIISAIYLDSNLQECKKFVKKNVLSNENPFYDFSKHPKSYLQELCLKQYKSIPCYELIGRKGPDHNPRFLVKVKVNKELSCTAEGKSIQMAEENAAKEIILLMKK